jgi:acyl-CoA synthetase (NDP forming)/RimJ/RimL family protein N-acetyltransferase
MAKYPSELDRPGLLKDGRSIRIRPIRADDTDRMLEMYGRLSRQSIAFRFLGPVVTIRRDAMRRFTDIDYVDDLALVALHGEQVLGVVRLVRSQEHPDHAEVTFLIADDYQGVGLGGLLLEHIVPAARSLDIEVLEATVLPDNARMLATISSSGYRHEIIDEGSVIHIDIAVSPRAQVIRRSRRRITTRTRSSLAPLMTPRSVVLVGATDRPETIGGALTRNLVSGFGGAVHLVNPDRTSIGDRPVFASVRDLPEQVDLAIVAVRAEAVRQVVSDCAARGVSVVLIVSVGFAETGPAGAELERDIVVYARQHGMRVLGPNSMGIVLNTAGSQLAATFAQARPPAGPVAMASQSGTIGLSVLDRASRHNVGYTAFVSIGNGADIDAVELLEWWSDDPATSVVLVDADALDNPRDFARLLRGISPRKPVVVVHPGISRAAGDPSGIEQHPRNRARARLDEDAVLSELFQQAGVIRARDQEQLFNLGLVLANQPVPAGDRTVIVVNGNGPGQLTAAACRASGLTLGALSTPTLDRIRSDAPASSVTRGVVNLTPMATPLELAEVLDAVLAEDDVHAVIVVYTPPLVTHVEEVAAAIRNSSSAHRSKTVVASFLGLPGVPTILQDSSVRIPSFTFPETAATTLGMIVRYADWRRQAAGIQPHLPGIRRSAVLDMVQNRPVGEMDPTTVRAMFVSYGLRCAAEDVAGVPAGEVVRLRLGMNSSGTFGPVLTLTVDDPLVEMFGDVAFRLTPLSDRDADDMVQSLRAYPLIRGGPQGPGDEAALRDVLLRMSALVEDVPELNELAVVVSLRGVGEGAVIVEATAHLGAPDQSRVPMEPAVSDRAGQLGSTPPADSAGAI